jgi:long-chain acyl-CoA synthetase
MVAMSDTDTTATALDQTTDTATDGWVRSGARRVARTELMERAARAASAMAATGAQPGGAIAVLMRNDLPFVEAVFASGFVGAQAVPINWHFTPEEVGYILQDSGASHLVAHADLLPALMDVLPERIMALAVETPPEVCAIYGIDPADGTVPAGVVEWGSWLEGFPPRPGRVRASGGTMMYTSGTTGRPKGVRRAAVSADRMAADAALRQRWFGNRPGMRTAIIGPMYHSVQLSYTTAAVSAPGEVDLLPRFDAEALLELIESRRITHLHLVPIMMSRLVKLPAAVRDRYDVSSLEFVVHGSAPCPPEVKRALIAWFGPVVHEYYGTTECGMVSRASCEEWIARPGTVGRPYEGRTIRILDPDGRPLPPGEEGEVYASLGTMANFTYQNAPDERAKIERDGCVTSGDIGYLDQDGYLYLCDRRSDTVISGGVNIYPAEVEAVLSDHEAVLDAAVFGVPDPEFGERPMGLVSVRDAAQITAEELVAYAQTRLASYKVPRTIEFRDSLARDESGKIARRHLREPYWQAAGRRI